MNASTPPSLSRDTRTVRAAIDSDLQHGAVVPPIHLSSNFSFAGFDQKRPYDYSRSGNPTRDQLADALADLEQGQRAIVTASGMAAVCLVLNLLQRGDVLLAAHDCYGGTHRAFEALAPRLGISLIWADMTDPVAAEQAIATHRPALIWLETPSNPLLRITDIARIVTQARQIETRVAVDNTFLSPLGQQPLALGADLVVHSTTKYINGHSDVVGGAVIARDAAVAESLAWWANCLGVTGAPFDSFLTLRGLRTMAVRLRQHQDNALIIAESLASHPRVQRVHFPGLSDHPGHALARRQQTGFGAMMSFELAAIEDQHSDTLIRHFLARLSCFTLAESLGGVESLIAHPATMTHAAMSPEARRQAGISDALLRLSVGIEHPDDLLGDLLGALDALDDLQGQTHPGQQSRAGLPA